MNLTVVSTGTVSKAAPMLASATVASHRRSVDRSVCNALCGRGRTSSWLLVHYVMLYSYRLPYEYSTVVQYRVRCGALAAQGPEQAQLGPRSSLTPGLTRFVDSKRR